MDRRARQDVAWLMNQAEFRRFLQWMFMICGLRDALPLGNSKDIYNAGRRSVAVQLSHLVDSIEKPERTTGLKLRLQSEMEYTELELSVAEHFKMLYSKLESTKRYGKWPKDKKQKGQQ